jgi:uncharacterized membrane protein
MSDSKFAKQLLGKLPSLVDGKIIDANSAESLRRHYAPPIKQSRSLSIGLTISAVLGGLLIGAGIILLLAHNWDDLTRPTRAVLSILPLMIGVLLAGYAILRRSDSAAWREGSGVFYFLSIGASIALVSQTYHLYNDLSGFLFAWLLLTLPLIYLLRSGTVFIGYLACLVAYNFTVNKVLLFGSYYQIPIDPQPLVLLLAALPFFAWQVWRRRETLMVTWLGTALTIALPLMMMAYLDKRDFSYWQLSFGGLFTLFYLVACRWFSELRGWRNPFRNVGCLGIAVIAVILTFKEPYLDVLKMRPFSHWALALWLLAGLLWVITVGDLCRRKLSFNWVVVLFPGVIAIGVFLLAVTRASLLMNVYVFALGVFTLVRGVKRDSLLSMNEGMLLLTALIVSRFFDSDYGFVARDVAFIVIGLGFLGMNLWVLVNRKNNKELAV